MENETQKELEWQESIEIPEGSHIGTVTKVTYKSEPYEYTDIFIKLDDVDVELKYGCPTLLSEKSKLGRLLITFGETFAKGKKTNPAEVLINKRVKLMTMNKKNKEGQEFARVVEDSVKPL